MIADPINARENITSTVDVFGDMNLESAIDIANIAVLTVMEIATVILFTSCRIDGANV